MNFDVEAWFVWHESWVKLAPRDPQRVVAILTSAIYGGFLKWGSRNLAGSQWKILLRKVSRYPYVRKLWRCPKSWQPQWSWMTLRRSRLPTPDRPPRPDPQCGNPVAQFQEATTGDGLLQEGKEKMLGFLWKFRGLSMIRVWINTY